MPKLLKQIKQSHLNFLNLGYSESFGSLGHFPLSDFFLNVAIAMTYHHSPHKPRLPRDMVLLTPVLYITYLLTYLNDYLL